MIILDFVDTWEKLGVLTQEYKDKPGKKWYYFKIYWCLFIVLQFTHR